RKRVHHKNRNKVDQSPPDLIRKLTESAVLTCSHSDQGFELILWYKRSDDKGLIFLEFMDKIVMSGNGNSNGLFTIKNLASSDSAVYFCAAC
uniref:Ig-like domain-containing protein n=1 Tax=Cyprinus carpio TaxID=7962 RepID=A0A8C2INT0_CYPCA